MQKYPVLELDIIYNIVDITKINKLYLMKLTYRWLISLKIIV